MNDLLVETLSGSLQGFLDRGVPNWRGVPYGRVERRFHPAVPAGPDGHVEATRWGPISWQLPMYPGMSWQMVYPDTTEQEDCLNLNIWSPGADGGARPVLVWFHPGGRVAGSGSMPVVDPWVFAARHDAVVITANCRLGPWGGLYLGAIDPEFGDSANLAVLDQVLLLRWIRDNIGQFGGDPNNVTIFGISSGASDVGNILGVPAARGLFHKAALYSGNVESAVLKDEAVRRAEKYLAEAGPLARTPADLANVPNVALRYVHRKLLRNSTRRANKAGRVLYDPFIDGTVVPRPPLESIGGGLSADVPVLVSVVAEEARVYDALSPGTIDRLYDSLHGPDPDAEHDKKIQFVSERFFFQPAERLLTALHAAGGHGWSQLFDYMPTNSPLNNEPAYQGRPVHGVDMSALFIDPAGAVGDDVDRAVAAEEQSALMGLARNGCPHWERWSPAHPQPHHMKP